MREVWRSIKRKTELPRDQETTTGLDLKEQKAEKVLPKEQGGGTHKSALGANAARVCIADAAVNSLPVC